MASYEKHTWTDDEVITKERLNHIEEGIYNIELTPGPKGDSGEKGEIDALTVESATTQQIATTVNNLIADLKAKGYMNEA